MSSVSKLPFGDERRGPDRPTNGDVRLCPRCGENTFEFNARSRVALEDGSFLTVAAWRCDSPACKFARFARAAESPTSISPVLRRKSRQLRATASRSLMKSGAVRQRASRTLIKSAERRKKKTGH
jgi:hypothetical protein